MTIVYGNSVPCNIWYIVWQIRANLQDLWSCKDFLSQENAINFLTSSLELSRGAVNMDLNAEEGTFLRRKFDSLEK